MLTIYSNRLRSFITDRRLINSVTENTHLKQGGAKTKTFTDNFPVVDVITNKMISFNLIN